MFATGASTLLVDAAKAKSCARIPHEDPTRGALFRNSLKSHDFLSTEFVCFHVQLRKHLGSLAPSIPVIRLRDHVLVVAGVNYAGGRAAR